MKLREGLADVLVAEGVELVFVLMGDANQDLICDLGERCGVQMVSGRHEQGVVGMADGYARFAGRPGVAAVTQGPGLTNTATSLVAAQRRRSPVLVLAGDASLGDLHNPQLFDQQAFGVLMAGGSARVESPRCFDDTLAQAFQAMNAHRPFVLNLPGDVQNASLHAAWRYEQRHTPFQPVLAAPSRIEQAAVMIADAERPAVLAGRGAVVSGAGPALAEMAELVGAPLTTTLLANGLFAGHELNAGVCGGLGDGRALKAIEHCDVIVAVGTTLNQWTTHFGTVLEGRKLIQIDIDPTTFGAYQVPELALQGDSAATSDALLGRLRERITVPRTPPAALSEVLSSADRLDPSPYVDTDHSVDPRRALAEVERALPDDRSIVIGGGHAAQVACQSLRASSPSNWTCTSIDFGALGQGLSVAVGACFARPDRRIYHVTADGEMMMGLSELDTAVRYSLSLTIVVLNDQSVGQEYHSLIHKGLPPSYASYPSPDLAELARAFGATGYRIDTADDLGQIDQALGEHHGVVIVDVRINGDYLNPASRDIAEHMS